jgi:hypothetical protein
VSELINYSRIQNGTQHKVLLRTSGPCLQENTKLITNLRPLLSVHSLLNVHEYHDGGDTYAWLLVGWLLLKD